MKPLLKTLFFILLLTSHFAKAQFPTGVLTIDMSVNSIEEMEANLIKGKQFPNSFLKDGLNICWNTKQKEILNGNHLLYAVKMPAFSKITVTAGSDVDISLYGYLMEKDDYTAPPKFPKKENMECKASFNAVNDFDKPEKLIFETFEVGKNLIIGVCGTKEITVGDINIRFNLETTIVKEEKPVVYKIKAVKDQKTGFKGDLANGTLMPLDWATTTETNCFSKNQLNEFDGNHVYYVMNLPENSRAKVTVHSLTRKKINIFGFTGHDGVSLPPKISQIHTCRASFSSFGDFSKQSITLVSKQPDRILLAIAGAKGADLGKYHLIVELKDLLDKK